MKKILGGLALLLLIIGGIFGYKYYSETYVMHTEYGKVPTEVPAKTPTKDASGNTVENMYSYNYKMTFYDETGKAHQRELEIHGEEISPLTPNSIIKIETNEKRNADPQVVLKNEVPRAVLEKIK
ncbi:DUF1093 domain-containing protein [Erwinia sp. CPCC 100877]|nr:DUF1093 domain-containing protein [Erwinia sp. CPCC 100877]